MSNFSIRNCEDYLEEYFNSIDKEEYTNNKHEYRQYSEHFSLSYVHNEQSEHCSHIVRYILTKDENFLRST